MIYVAIAVGIVFCSFLIAQLVFVFLHRKWTNKIIESADEDKNTSVSIIHPIKDLDFELEQNLESWMNQNYKGKLEHIFSFQDPEDPAIPVVSEFVKKFPHVDTSIIVNSVMQGLNGKSSNMVYGVKAAKYDIVLFGDSDVRIKEDFVVKMARPLKDEKVGITTCGQINLGGKDFWTRFFTFTQNTETDFMWAFLTKLGMDVGATGAAFGMRKKLLKELGGLEVFGGSLLEDLHLGNTLYKMGYKLFLGPFLNCHVQKLGKEKTFNYARRLATGIKAHIALELPTFILMLFWYWILLAIGLISGNVSVIYLSIAFLCFRMLHGVMTRVVSGNKVYPIDIVMGPMIDVIGTFFLIFASGASTVEWRGIKYEVKAGGFIDDAKTEPEFESKS